MAALGQHQPLSIRPGHIQSLILGGAFLSMGFIAYLVGLVADLISHNRQLIEITLERVRKMRLDTYAEMNNKEKKSSL